QAAGDIIALPGRDDAHPLFFQNAARTLVRDRFRSAQYGEPQSFEPELSHSVAGFGHQAATLPFWVEPETAIFILRLRQADQANDGAGVFLSANRPYPFFAARDGGQSDVAKKSLCSVGRIRPRHFAVEVLDDFPSRKGRLNLIS